VIDTFCKETVLYFPTNLRGNYSPEEAWGKLAKGCGDYSWRQPGEACAKWRELPAKWREMPAKWREVPAKWREVPAKWRKVAAKWRLLLESVRRVWW